MSKANSWRVILRRAEVLEIACKNRVRSASWSSLASSFAEQPELVEYLIRHRSAVPDPSTFDPFINALRRICWPGRRLPPSHSKAAGRIGRSPESFAALVFEEAKLSQGTGEDRAWLGLGRGLIEGVFAGDPAKADEIFTMALGEIDADTDPWLGLFLHYNAAKALLTGSFPPRISAGDLLAQLAPTPISLEERAGRLQAYYLRVADTRRDHIERARVHLELSRELCDELGSAEFKIRHRWLLAHAQQIADPIGAVESLLAAIELVKNNRQRVRMGRDFSQIFAQLERISVPEETRHALKTRAIELIPGLWAL